MARLIKAGEFASASEKLAAETLKSLPAKWVIICNKVLPRPNGFSSFELDFVIVADHWVFLLDEKSWRGQIRGNDQTWVFSNGSSTASPLSKVDYTAKVLAGRIRSRVPQLGDEFFVHGGVLLSAAEHRPTLTGEPRANAGIFLLADVCKRLQKLDQDGGTLLVQDYRDEIVDALTGLSTIPAVPKQIGTYEVEELLFTRPGVRAFQAKQSLGIGPQSRTLMVYTLGADSSEQQDARAFYLKEFEALKRLEPSGLTPRVSDPFPWSDHFLALPIEPLTGKSLAAHPAPETSDGVAAEVGLAAAAFRALDEMHQAGVVHRALAPDTVYVLASGEKPKVGFNNFYAARVGTQSIAISLDELAIEDPYAAPELALGYGSATPQSDTYSLALIFLERLSGKRVTDLRAHAHETVAVPPLKDRWTALPEATAQELTTLFDDIVGQSDPRERWPAADAAKLLGELSRRLRTEQPSSEPLVLDERYEVQRVLGRGASAITYLAKDRVTHDLVAIKRFHDPQTALQQVKAEWDALKKIASERLPRIYDVFPPENDAHVKLEYIPGPTLQEVEAEELPWDLTRWRAFALDLLDALSRLETQHILHRDIKPANIILRESDGRPVLIDCGFAVIAGTKGSPAGTPRFMPPESPTAVDPPPSCDRYALAFVLYRALTGRYPDTCDDATALSELRLAGRTSEGLAMVSRILETLRRAISSDSSARPESAQALQAALMQAFQRVVNSGEMPPDRTPQINPWVAEVRGLYRNSGAGNANNRGLDTSFVRETYIPTALDEHLLPEILAKRPKAVFLSGNPGDGKTAFLARVREELERQGAQRRMNDASGWEVTLEGHIFRCCYDASEAHEGASADDQLAQKLAGLEGVNSPDIALTSLVAINDGRLADFFERKQASFEWLARQIRVATRPNHPADAPIWIIDLKRRAFVSDGRSSEPSIARRVLQSLVNPEEWRICEQCASQAMCPIAANAKALRQPETTDRLERLLLLTHLRRRRHITMRDLRSTLAYLISGDAGCEDIHAMREGRMADRSPRDLTYWRAIFTAPDGLDDLTADLADLDPGREARPTLDRFLYFHRQPADAEQRRALFADNSDLAPQTYTSEADWIADVKRRLYFDGAPLSVELLGGAAGSGLLAYRYADEFLAALQGEATQWKLKQRIARGILRSDGVNVRPGDDKLGLKVSASEEEEIIILKEFPLMDFAAEPEEIKGQHAVEEIREALRFRRRQGSLSLTLTLDLFELLMRLADGLQPDAPELRPLLEDLVPFKNALLLEETRDLTVIEGQGRVHHITQRDGKIVRIGAMG
jgi:serine/threonine protein kinase